MGRTVRGRGRLDRFRVPEPPASLRTAALGRIESLAAGPPSRAGLLDLLASSPAWWLAWSTALLLILLAEPRRLGHPRAESLLGVALAQASVLDPPQADHSAAVPEGRG